MSVGISKIDVQHRTLIRFINDAYRAMEGLASEDELKETLENLIDYSRVHFAYEEKLFLESRYPETKEHQKEHLGYCNTILEYYSQYLTGQTKDISELCLYLKNWLHHHVMVNDKKYSRFILAYLANKA